MKRITSDYEYNNNNKQLSKITHFSKQFEANEQKKVNNSGINYLVVGNNKSDFR